MTKTTDALQNETVTAYKSGGRLLSTTNARNFTTTFDRTPVQSSITDALTRTTVTSLTALGLPTGTQYPDETSTGSAYLGTTRLDESQSFPTSFEDELSRERTFGYDARSGLQSATDLAGEAWSYTYAPSQGAAISYDAHSLRSLTSIPGWTDAGAGSTLSSRCPRGHCERRRRPESTARGIRRRLGARQIER